jgi:hypothetical protein
VCVCVCKIIVICLARTRINNIAGTNAVTYVTVTFKNPHVSE